MTLKFIITVFGISLFLGIVIYSIRVLLNVYKVYSKPKYESSKKYFRELLMLLQDEALKLRNNTDQNTLLIEFDGTKDIIFYLYNKRPKIDIDGEIFVYIGIMPFGRVISYRDLNPIYIFDTATGKEYCKYNRSVYKRIDKMRKVLSSDDPNINVNVTWTTEDKKVQDIKRDFVLDNLERGRLP